MITVMMMTVTMITLMASVRKASSFVLPTKGAVDSLTLSTFLTDAADLHFAVVDEGHEPLTAVAIKSSAERCRVKGLPEQSKTSPGATAANLPNIVAAGTVVVERAQKVERVVSGLRANTSYDIYFVAEVPASNGVFGSVLSVLKTSTHPQPPEISLFSAQPANASSNRANVSLTLSTPGRGHIALLPSATATVLANSLSAVDFVQQAPRYDQAVFGAQSRDSWDDLSVQLAVNGLLPATDYDVFIVTEAVGDGAVYSTIVRRERAFHTHANAPAVANVYGVPKAGSASALVVHYTLRLREDDVDRSIGTALPYYSYYIHVTATPEASTINSENQPAVVNWTFAFGDFDSHDELVQALGAKQSQVLDGLASGTSYNISVQVETRGSNGLSGRWNTALGSITHAKAPAIISASADPTNNTVRAVTLSVELERPGDIHYVLSPRASNTLRSSYSHASTPEELVELLATREATIPVHNGSIRLDSIKTGVNTTGTFSHTFNIDGLSDNTAYSIAVFSETHGSGGVFSKAFTHLVETSTNENASAVALVSALPVKGSTSSVVITVQHPKSNDVLYQCVNAATNDQSETCHEVTTDDMTRVGAPHENQFQFQVGNFTSDTTVHVQVYAESTKRNGVLSERTVMAVVKTHAAPPPIVRMHATPTDAAVDQVLLEVEIAGPGFIHYAVQDPSVNANHEQPELTAPHVAGTQALLPFTSPFVVNKHEFANVSTWTVPVGDLKANRTYTIHVATETSLAGEATGVYGTIASINVTTHALAAKITNAVVDPIEDRIDGVVLAVNLSSPGTVHYFLSDIDFADPAIIKRHDHGDVGITPHVLRGELIVHTADVVLEWDNVTNETRPSEPRTYSRNTTIRGLKEGTTYHVSLTTETPNSNGVFGDFPPPILVTTHTRAPVFVPETFRVQPMDGSSTSLVVNFQLDQLGEVHYVLFFRGLIRDRSSDLMDELQREKEANLTLLIEEKKRKDPNDTSVVPRWPPPTSEFDLSHLNATGLKAALYDELGPGVLQNGTISVSREDVRKLKLMEKEFKDLPPNACYDLCLVPETAASNGIFAWNGVENNCHRLTTHSDYSNQSILLDEVSVAPLAAATDGLVIELFMSKLMEAPEQTAHISDRTERFAVAGGRVPYFLVLDGKEGRRDFFHNSFTSLHTRDASTGFLKAVPGRGHVAAVGQFTEIVHENATTLHLRQTVRSLRENREHFVFFAYETAYSNGLFSKINPHRHRPNDTHHENEGISVRTHEHAPHLSRYEAIPTFGNTTRVTVQMDVSCVSCKEAIMHVLLYPNNCSAPSMELLRAPATSSSNVSDPCSMPLARRKIKVTMSDREHSKSNVEEDVDGLQPNTTYAVYVATETAGSDGVFSLIYRSANVTTFAPPPTTSELVVAPRNGTTTDMVLNVQLSRPGHVHVMAGKAGQSELNVTSPFNVSNKRWPGKDAPNCHDYPRDVVRLRRSFPVEHAPLKLREVLDYLEPGTAYDVFVVVESLDDKGIYGPVHTFANVTTFDHAPLLLAHAAFPTPATTTSLTVGYRVDKPGLLHVSVIQTTLHSKTQHVANGSDQYGNRLAIQDKLVQRATVNVTTESMLAPGGGGQLARDSDWRELNVSVPEPGARYTVFLVTESDGSEGVYGQVASHKDVVSYALAPTIEAHAVAATDARVDALTARVKLSAPGHVHYRVQQAHSAHTVKKGDATLDVCATNCSLVFDIDGLQEGTSYDVFFQTETLRSHGVLGQWTPVPLVARTHGLPPDVLEHVECNVTPSCEALGRQQCLYEANVCGPCQDGWVGDNTTPNSVCIKQQQQQQQPSGVSSPRLSLTGKKNASIKISGVRVNPSLHTAGEAAVTADTTEPQAQSGGRMQSILENPFEPAAEEITACPLHAELDATNQCVCVEGFEPDADGSACVLASEVLSAGAAAAGGIHSLATTVGA
ncbi:TPA: hypothetical protein N0F65_006501 [Lagenidium giganteum]|uniref:Fibronectin type-III domain-containing protein n=1 Tax=Lagenidium giganteum TaxID=4803 RepID=A0AAV2YNA5_9STRA|nr:TPA: hypothetical protein N0F65_006501 [Lagenidium giganteum]